MAEERSQYQTIEDFAVAYSGSSDAQVLAALVAIPPLADEANSCWWDEEYWLRIANPFMALWKVAADRHLRTAVPLIFDRACFGDPFEIMRTMRHFLEKIFEPDWNALTVCCIAALQSHRAGTRLWAADELGVLRDTAAISALEVATRDEIPEIRARAAAALLRIRGN